MEVVANPSDSVRGAVLYKRSQRRDRMSTLAEGAKAQCIREMSFGNQVAEEERDTLKEYFVRTQAWDRIQRGEIDIIYGPKGAGKSALYVLTQEYAPELRSSLNVVQIAAENPRGMPAFKDLDVDPPTTEREFISIWKLYFASLLGRALDDYAINNEHAQRARRLLDEHDLLPLKRTALGSVLTAVRGYVSRVFRPSSVEGGVSVEPGSGVPSFTGKIVFEDPDIAAQKLGVLSVDELLGDIDAGFGEAGIKAWLMIDRLDVAFDESSELERNALRALFRAYRDLRSHEHVTAKIFLRTDIWKRITQEGFREATHMSRDISLRWDKPTLKNLVVRRLLNNKAVLQLYGLDKEDSLSTVAKQEAVFQQVFPDQVEIGEKQSNTFDWILRRTSDGTGSVQPRDVILFLNTLVEIQNRRLERGEQEPPGTWLFDRSSFKEAMPVLSEHKVTRVIFAEYPHLRQAVDALRETKTEHNLESLTRIWGITEEQALVTARSLRDIGFFEERTSKGETSYWVPFVYRSYLAMSQGKVEEMLAGQSIDMSWYEELDALFDDEDVNGQS